MVISRAYSRICSRSKTGRGSPSVAAEELLNRMPDISPPATGWDTYWQGAGSGAAFSRGGTSHPVVLSFWGSFFAKVREDYVRPRVADIASGSGAVVDCALST